MLIVMRKLFIQKYSAERLSKYISGHGVSAISRIDSDDNRCTFVIEDTIAFDSHKAVKSEYP